MKQIFFFFDIIFCCTISNIPYLHFPESFVHFYCGASEANVICLLSQCRNMLSMKITVFMFAWFIDKTIMSPILIRYANKNRFNVLRFDFIRSHRILLKPIELKINRFKINSDNNLSIYFSLIKSKFITLFTKKGFIYS